MPLKTHSRAPSILLYLADNAGANFVGGFAPGSSGSASNSQCSIYGSGSSVSGSGTQLAVTVPVTFQSAFSSGKNEYLYAQDNEGLYTGWQQMGTWTVTAPALPSVTLSAPANGSGNLSTSPTLSWSQSTGATAYDVYLGTSNPPAFFASNISNTSYVANGLNPGTVYFWTVVAKNSSGSAAALERGGSALAEARRTGAAPESNPRARIGAPRASRSICSPAI